MGLTFEDALTNGMETSFQMPKSLCLEAGVYGGFLLAIAVNKVEAESPHPVRSLQMNFSALAKPDTDTECHVELMRRGSKSGTFSIKFTQAGQCVAHGAIFVGADRGVVPDNCYSSPHKVPPLEAVPALPKQMPAPPFTKHFHHRPCIGGMVGSGAPPETGGYIWFREDEVETLSRAHVAALVDAWWPSFFVSIAPMRPMASASLQVNFGDVGRARPNEPCLLEIQGELLSGSFGSEKNRLWSATGELLASAHQSIVIIA